MSHHSSRATATSMLNRAADGVSRGRDAAGALLRRAAAGSVLEARTHYRTAIGILGITLPICLMISSRIAGRGYEGSISAYYYTIGRDWLVGTLWAIGVFLFFYHYQPRQAGLATSRWRHVRSGVADAWLGKLAGISAVIVALFPTNPPPSSATQPPTIGLVHGAAALSLFLWLSLFPLLLFSQSRQRARVHKAYGGTMLGLLLLALGYTVAPESVREALAPGKPILIIETLLVWIFGISWFDKGVLGQRLLRVPDASEAT